MDKPLNKGIQIRNKKRTKNRKKMGTVKSKQVGLCRFISVKETVISRINGKFRSTGKFENFNGLQIENRLFLQDASYKFINRGSIQITRVYTVIPDWASENLIEKYEISKLNKETDNPAGGGSLENDQTNSG